MAKKLKDLPLTAATAKSNGIDEVTVGLILATAGIIPEDAPDSAIAAFLHNAARARLDPLARQIYMREGSSRGTKVYTSMVSIDGFRLAADRTEVYLGSDDVLFDEGLTQYQMINAGRKPKTATVTVRKVVKGLVGTFTTTASWESYCPTGGQDFMWKKFPYLMLGKVAEALALRKAFPAELSGLYAPEEMAQSGIGGDEADKAAAADNGYANKNALFVADRLEKIGVKLDDARIIKYLGAKLEEANDDKATNDKLKTLWQIPVRVDKGEVVEEVLNSLVQ